MSSANPYRPPGETAPEPGGTSGTSSDAADPPVHGPINYRGGLASILGVAIGFGALCLLILGLAETAVSAFDSAFVAFLLLPLLVLCLALGCTGALLRNTESPLSRRITMCGLLAIPAYVLFVPVCGFATVFAAGGMAGRGSGFASLGFGILVSFVAILLLFATIIRANYRSVASYRHSADGVESDPVAEFGPLVVEEKSADE